MAKNIRIVPLDGDIVFTGTSNSVQVLDIQYSATSNSLFFQNEGGIPF